MASALPSLPARDPHGHKGTFGTVAVIGGCSAGAVRMVGAPALCALGALRAGCGLARAYAPAPIIGEVLTIAPSATGRALAVNDAGEPETSGVLSALREAVTEAHAVVIGPGMGVSVGAIAGALAAMRATGGAPCVLDADAINALALAGAENLAHGFGGAAVITPHPGEFDRLRVALGVGTVDRAAAAREVATRLRCVVVLKGHRTLVTDGARDFENDTGNEALATAGTGDVLAGVIAGLIAQHGPRAGAPADRRTMDVFTLAAIGVRVHGAAADAWRAIRGASGGMLANDLLECVPGAVQAARARP